MKKQAAKLFIVTFLFSTAALAQVDLSQTDVLVLPENQLEASLTSEQAYKIQPKKAHTGSSEQSVISEMVDNSVSLWWETTPLRQTSVGRAAESVEKKLNAEVKFSDSEDKTIEHKMSFKVLAMQALAKIEYFGWFRAALNFDLKNNSSEAEILEKLNNNKDLVISHTVTTNENKSQLSLRWNW